MKNTKTEKQKGMDYIWLALTAFGGLGLEALYAYLLEPLAYGCGMQDFKTWQVILHWIITCSTWGMGHWLTKGTLAAGLYSAFGGFCFGTVYLLLNRNIKLTYGALCIMFILLIYTKPPLGKNYLFA